MITVLVTSCNKGKYLKIAIESILNQNYKDIELIVIDDGSTDGSTDGLNIPVIYNENHTNQSYSINQAIKMAKGEYFIHLDADDTYFLDSLEILVENIGDADYIYGNLVLTDKNGHVFDIWSYKQYTNEEIIKYTLLRGGSSLVPMVGLFRTDFLKKIEWGWKYISEDAITTIKASEAGWKTKYIDFDFYLYRRWEHNTDYTRTDDIVEAKQAVVDYINKNHNFDISVVLVCIDDWSNLGYLLAESLKSVGIKAKAIAKNKHVFDYPNQADEWGTDEELKKELSNADIVVFMHSQGIQFDWKDKKLFVFHTGTLYRENSRAIRDAFQKMNGTIVNHYDFLEPDDHWLMRPIDTKTLQPEYKWRKLKFAHYPRHPEINGYERVKSVVEKCGCNFVSDTNNVSWKENIERMRDCDIYIEQLAGHDTGMTSLEAASLGKVVITSFKGLERYEKEYGKCELLIANNEEELEKQIKYVMDMNQGELKRKKKATRKWVETYHSFESIGKRFKEILIT